MPDEAVSIRSAFRVLGVLERNTSILMSIPGVLGLGMWHDHILVGAKNLQVDVPQLVEDAPTKKMCIMPFDQEMWDRTQAEFERGECQTVEEILRELRGETTDSPLRDTPYFEREDNPHTKQQSHLGRGPRTETVRG